MDIELNEIAYLANALNSQTADIHRICKELKVTIKILEAKCRSLDTIQTHIFKNINLISKGSLKE